MGHLVTSSGVLHGGELLELTLAFVEDPEIIQNYSPKVILFLLTTTHVDLVQDLDGSEFARHLLHVADADFVCLLVGQLVDEDSTGLLIVVMEAGLLRLKDVVGLEAHDVL